RGPGAGSGLGGGGQALRETRAGGADPVDRPRQPVEPPQHHHPAGGRRAQGSAPGGLVTAGRAAEERRMKLTIFAATGGIGRQLLAQAIAAGHDVTAVARSPEALGPARVRVVKADLTAADPDALRAAVEGADAVLSGLGPRAKADAGVAARGTRAI